MRHFLNSPMSECIMKRGLSLEGCEIRQKHQSSLLNEEFGVTSQTSHRKIEKNFLADNIMKLKEIQAKGRTHQAIPPSSHPVKAIWLKDADISHDEDIKGSQGVPSQKDRQGSAHSDYFSLSDETPSTDVEQNSYDCPVKASDALTKDSPVNNFGNTGFSSVPKSEFDTNYNASYSKAKTFSSSLISATFCTPTTQCPPLEYILKKIRKQKPACDLNWNIVWKGIEKEHKIIFHNQISLPTTTLKDTAPRKSSTSGGCNCLVTPKDAKSTRSQSLDRINQHTASNQCNSFSGSTSLLSVHSTSHKQNDHQTDEPLIPSASPPKLLDKETISHSNSFLINSSPNQLSLSSAAPCTPFKENDFHLEDAMEPKMDNENSAKASGVEWANVNAYCSNKMKSDRGEIDHMMASSVASTTTKKDASIQTSYKPPPMTHLIRSKLLGNCCSVGNLPPSYKRGEIPKYLKVRKAKIQQHQEAAAAIDPLCPPGHNPLPDYERRNTLHLLKKGQATVIKELCALPLVQDTLTLQKRKQQLEGKLAQIDEGIQIFSRPKVYIISDD